MRPPHQAPHITAEFLLLAPMRQVVWSGEPDIDRTIGANRRPRTDRGARPRRACGRLGRAVGTPPGAERWDRSERWLLLRHRSIRPRWPTRSGCRRAWLHRRLGAYLILQQLGPCPAVVRRRARTGACRRGHPAARAVGRSPRQPRRGRLPWPALPSAHTESRGPRISRAASTLSTRSRAASEFPRLIA